MASLVLLLEALMRCCKNDILPSEEMKEANYDTNHNVGNHRNAPIGDQHIHYIRSIVKKLDEDAHTWKIAEFCIWP